METNVTPSTHSAFEFSEEQNTVIKSLSAAMRWVGAVLLVVGALQCLGGILNAATGGLPNLLQGIICIIFAVFTYRAADAFRRIVDSVGEDVTHLMVALNSLRSLYRLQVIILAVAATILILALFAGFIRS